MISDGIIFFIGKYGDSLSPRLLPIVFDQAVVRLYSDGVSVYTFSKHGCCNFSAQIKLGVYTEIICYKINIGAVEAIEMRRTECKSLLYGLAVNCCISAEVAEVRYFVGKNKSGISPLCYEGQSFGNTTVSLYLPIISRSGFEAVYVERVALNREYPLIGKVDVFRNAYCVGNTFLRVAPFKLYGLGVTNLSCFVIIYIRNKYVIISMPKSDGFVRCYADIRLSVTRRGENDLRLLLAICD